MNNEERLVGLFGSAVFSEEEMKKRLPEDICSSLIEIIDTGKELDPDIADSVAAAMKDWAIENGATHYTHWFQPLNGITAEKHDAFMSPLGHGKAIMEFSKDELIMGEPDASSFPSGGLRATFEARGYTAWDPQSYAFIKDGSLCIPTVFCSYTGDSLDAKTPLIRSTAAINEAGLELLGILGDTTTKSIITNVGAEQEYFLIDENDFLKRRDLYFTGRTLFGSPSVKGQELDDHYFGSLRPKVSAYMKELDLELWKLGIAVKTKHNETAPAQHELAPIFTSANIAVDQNLLTMEIMKKIANKHGMECLLAEKPFDGINGSGKHNNWSISTDKGENLLKPKGDPRNDKRFMLILSAVIKAVDDYQELLRISSAGAGNDCRLGANEAPPAIISVFLGEDLDKIVNSIVDGAPYEEKENEYMSFGARSLPALKRDNTDRNRTSPFAFTGNKFEFRMVGSSQNIALPNIVLSTAVAKSFRDFANVLRGQKDLDTAIDKLIKDTLRQHRRILFSGNSYSPVWKEEAKRRGLANLATSPEAYAHFTDEKNLLLFKSFGVMSETEMNSRREIMFASYRKTKSLEARVMIEVVRRDIIPAVSEYIGNLSEAVVNKRAALKGVSLKAESEIIESLSDILDKIYITVNELEALRLEARKKHTDEEKAFFYKDFVIAKMDELRSLVDSAEALTDRKIWPMPSYSDILYRV